MSLIITLLTDENNLLSTPQFFSLAKISSQLIAAHELESGEKAPTKLFCVKKMASFLKVKPRRIYDIINVLESIQIASRAKDGHYTWNGLDALDATLEAFKHKFAPTNSTPQLAEPVGLSYRLDKCS